MTLGWPVPIITVPIYDDFLSNLPLTKFNVKRQLKKPFNLAISPVILGFDPKLIATKAVSTYISYFNIYSGIYIYNVIVKAPPRVLYLPTLPECCIFHTAQA